jgi:ribose 5-phosphate isomerase RpiB
VMNRLVEIWLATDFEAGRHSRRLEKISQYESQSMHRPSDHSSGCP